MYTSTLLALFLVPILSVCNGRIIPKFEFPILKNYRRVNDPDCNRNVSGLITSKGYPVEEHKVQTEDGFILSIQRIPHGRKESKTNEGKQVVYLQHGLFGDSTNFVLNLANQSLGFILADAGYDVWLGNTRGNTYSRSHVKYFSTDEEFWDFSFDEMAKYDLPAMIDYILKVTGQKKLFYVGHSQGTTSAFALLSESMQYNDKIELFIALAPAVLMGHMTTIIADLAPFAQEIYAALNLIGIRELPPADAIEKFLLEELCESRLQVVCEDLTFLICGADFAQTNASRLAVYLAHFPSGSSTKSVVHYAQLVNSNKFQKFDYGALNYLHYGQNTPPEYDVSKITTPVALMWGVNDKLADPADVLALQYKLRSLVTSYEVPFPAFNHLDFAIAINAKQLVYDELLKLINQHTDN